VTAGVPIIDLDVTPAGAEGEALRRRFTPARTALIFLVVLATLTALSAAAPPAPVITHLLSAGGQPAAAFVLSPDSLFTASFGANPNSESAVRRWDLTDGGQRWAAAVPQNVQNLVYDDTAHVLMGRSGAEPNAIFLDADTGAVLWHDDSPNSVVVSMVGGRALMATEFAADQRRLRLVEARTGRQVWSRVVDAAGYFGPDELWAVAPTRLIAVGTTGHAVVLRYTDGAVLTEGDLDVEIVPQFDGAFSADYVGVSTVGDVLYVSRRERGATSLTAWSIGSLTPLWRAVGGPAGLMNDCGPALCVAGQDFLSALDPADGRVLWRRSGPASAFRYDERSVLAYDRSDIPEGTLLDPATGAVLRRLGRVVHLNGVLLRGDGVLFGRTWVEVTDGDDAQHVVGVLDTAAPYGCAMNGPYLACPTTAGPTQVWRVPLHPT
jgi:outer membrane protein assembly factor BamB